MSYDRYNQLFTVLIYCAITYCQSIHLNQALGEGYPKKK